ncbi:MAG: DNA repair protein RecO [Succinivibrio sp.]|nr:DNA repair protein RecO [Succinivibrio sp.]
MDNRTFWEKEPSILIHKRDYREHSLLLDFFCLNLGRISAVYHVPQKNRSRAQADLQPYLPLSLNLKSGRSELMVLCGVEWVEKSRAASLAVPNLFCAQYLNELLYYLIRQGSTEPALFVCYMQTLSQIEKGQQIALSLRHFEAVLLESLGYALPYPQLCSSQDFDPKLAYRFSLEQGFYPSRGLSDPEALSGEVLQAISLKDYQYPGALAALKMLHTYILNQLLAGRELESRKLYRAYLALN